MLGDTITITVNSVAKALSKINQDQYASEYFLKEAGGEFRLKVRHSKDKVTAGAQPRDRHVITFTETVYATSTTPVVARQSSVTIVGNYNDAAVNQQYDTSGLLGYLTAANITKLINWES